MNYLRGNTGTQETAMTGLAVVGFIALVSAGVWLAVYASKYVPVAVGELGAAAVFLSDIFNPAPQSPLTPPVSTTTQSTTATTTPATTTPSVSTTTPTQPTTPTTPRTPGEQTSHVFPIGSTTTAPYGLPDLTPTIVAVGYLTSPSTTSFVASSTVPQGMRPAVKFTIRNAGTNVSGAWRFSASLPTSVNPLYMSNPQQTLGPGDYIEYTLGFEFPNRGTQSITISANFDRTVGESNVNNNNATSQITIQ